MNTKAIYFSWVFLTFVFVALISFFDRNEFITLIILLSAMPLGISYLIIFTSPLFQEKSFGYKLLYLALLPNLFALISMSFWFYLFRLSGLPMKY